jgi:cardiolipin synthase
VRPPGYELYTEGDSFYADMLRAIRSARREIQIMMYIWQDDHVGRLFRQALEKKCREGVEITVVADAIGSFDLPGNFFERLQALGSFCLHAQPLADSQLAMAAISHSAQPPQTADCR